MVRIVPVRHAELVSASHSEPSLVLLRGQILKQVQDDGWVFRMTGSVSGPSSFVMLNLFNFVQFAYARHSSSKLDSALAQSQISASHSEPFLVLVRGQILNQVQDDFVCGLICMSC